MARTSRRASSPSDVSGLAVGLTGGIGSGKTAVAELLAGFGAAIVDSDAIAHALTAPGGAAVGAIAQHFGAQYVRPDGALDRSRMRERVFRDPDAKAQLEALLHPRIRELAMEQAAAARCRAPYVVFVVPLLVESAGWRSRVDRVLVVDCSPSTQESRVAARSGLDPALVRAIMAQQAKRAERLDAADDVLVNEGPLELLAPRALRLHRRYCELARGGLDGL
ncbi:MAG: dephospho-CoA kinase [Burkholderiaceae bacterium]|nr:dephospho-CoA kinase [Burkholderiaceae bacterium]